MVSYAISVSSIHSGQLSLLPSEGPPTFQTKVTPLLALHGVHNNIATAMRVEQTINVLVFVFPRDRIFLQPTTVQESMWVWLRSSVKKKR